MAGRDHTDLTTEELEALAVGAYLTGDDEESAAAWEAAHRRHLAAGAGAEAARCSFWLALTLMLRGQMAHAGGWLGRTERAIGGTDCAASGYLLIPGMLGELEADNAAGAAELALRARELADRFDDPDLAALATLGHGQALIALGDVTAGLSRFDEAMLSVESSEVGPITAGLVYCAVILECMEVFDLARASEWTKALDGWCRSQPGLVPYRGQCLVHQSQLLQAAGDWDEAAATAALATGRLAEPPHPALGMAYYQEAELYRLIGSYDAAADAYARASQAGHEPMPGLAQLDLARGDLDAAAAGTRRALQEAGGRARRPALLAAAVEVFLAAGDRPAADEAAGELNAIAGGSRSPALAAMAAHAAGALLLDAGDAAGALRKLRSAAAAWQTLRVPYEAARSRHLVGLACSALGDSTTASLELEHARQTFARLGAVADRDRAPETGVSPEQRSGLSAREREVLSHVAAGLTNPEIAKLLTLSQHTVRRHLENIFAKLGVNTRAAATAYAYEHDLL